LEELLARYELRQEIDLPFPLGACVGYWGYELKNLLEPKLKRRAVNDLDLPDCWLGFYASLLVFDHRLDKAWIISTGMAADGTCETSRAQAEAEAWQQILEHRDSSARVLATPSDELARLGRAESLPPTPALCSNLSRADFLRIVERALVYIRAGDIYQVNLAQRLAASVGRDTVGFPLTGGLDLFEHLSAVSPAPFSAYLDAGDFQLVSSSPELFLRLSGSDVQTRPIKGTRPRAADPTQDAQLAYALQTSSKEMAELVMITDLLRNDLGKICQYGSVQVPDLARLERYPQVQHLVSTVEGRLRPETSHLGAVSSCFPGGSVTGAPKFRAMEIIDELEPVARGPYTGALGYLGFNRESQLSIIIRTAILKEGVAYFPVGAGIVADSDPAAEYEETLAKAAGFRAALQRPTTARYLCGARL
jgi:para-aminobenzoate synthetase component 1